MSLFNELKRRNVIRVGIAYIVIAWLSAQVLQLFMESFGAPDWVMKVVLILLASGIPFALLFAWIFELTPEGIKRETEIDRSQSITTKTGRKLDFTIIAILVLALGYFAWDKFVLQDVDVSVPDNASLEATNESLVTASPEQQVSSRSIAVLPFVNMSSDTDQEYFSDGISEEILNVLTKIPDLHVTSRSSAFAFKGKTVDIPTVAAQLGVANILEGSVRKSGNKVRITAQLIEASTDRHLWSETYDRELVDIFAIQDEISLAIVTALKGHLDLEDRSAAKIENRQTNDPAAYEAYLRGRHLIVQRTRPSLDAAVAEFQAAIQIDPGFALAHAQLAIAHMLLVNNQYGDYTFEEATALAVPHANKAMELDPALAESQAAAGFVLWDVGATPETLAYFEEALRINPNQSQVLIWMSVAFTENGDYIEALEFEEKLFHIDPLSTPNLGNLALSYASMGQTESVKSIISNLSVVSPISMLGTQNNIAWFEGDIARAIFFGLDSLLLEPENSRPKQFLSFQFAELGLTAEAISMEQPVDMAVFWLLGQYEEVIRTIEEKSARTVLTADDQRNLGQAYAATGDYEKALPMLEAAWEKSEHRVSQVGPFNQMDAAALIVARKSQDALADTNSLIDALTSHLQRMKDAGIIEDNMLNLNAALVDWFNGNLDGAFYTLERAVSAPFYMPTRLHYLQDLLNHPGYEPVQELRQAWLQGERQKFLSVVCGDSPYAEVWQPEPETCTQFLN
jgi:TolB-like protein